MRMTKLIVTWGSACVVAGLAVWAFAATKEPTGESEAAKVRVGTFDSRAVALAHFGSMVKKGWLEKLYADYEKAKAANDKDLAKQLEEKGNAQQKRLHEQVFGTAPVDDALEAVKREIPAVARSAGVDVVVCMHDVVYREPSVEFVDITDQIVDLFDPDEETLEKIHAIRKHAPVSREVLEQMEH